MCHTIQNNVFSTERKINLLLNKQLWMQVSLCNLVSIAAPGV